MRPTDPGHLDELRDRSLAAQAASAIRDAIFAGAIQPGARLTIERLAAELGVSRTPVREALKSLETEGLVQLLPHRGVVVTGLTADESDRVEIKAMLMGAAAELALATDGAGVAAALDAACRTLAGHVDDPAEGDSARRFGDASRDFQDAIRDGCGSPTLIRLISSLRRPVDMSSIAYASTKQRRATLATYRKIAAAFHAGDVVAARRLLEDYVRASGAALIAISVGETAA